MISSLPKRMSGMPKHRPDVKLSVVDIDLLNKLEKFRKEANDDGIWVSIEADELLVNLHSRKFHDIIELALETAKNGCIESTDPNQRYIKLRSRNTQNKTFVKIVYSCENQKRQFFDANLRKARMEIEKADGYLRHQFNNYEGIIKLAILNKSDMNLLESDRKRVAFE